MQNKPKNSTPCSLSHEYFIINSTLLFLPSHFIASGFGIQSFYETANTGSTSNWRLPIGRLPVSESSSLFSPRVWHKLPFWERWHSIRVLFIVNCFSDFLTVLWEKFRTMITPTIFFISYIQQTTAEKKWRFSFISWDSQERKGVWLNLAVSILFHWIGWQWIVRESFGDNFVTWFSSNYCFNFHDLLRIPTRNFPRDVRHRITRWLRPSSSFHVLRKGFRVFFLLTFSWPYLMCARHVLFLKILVKFISVSFKGVYVEYLTLPRSWVQWSYCFSFIRLT